MKRRIPLAPEEGWLTLGLVLLMCLALAWSVDSVKWVLGRDAWLDYLVYAAVGGVLVGFIGPKVGWGRWLTYLIGCVFAALIVPLLAAFAKFPGGAPLRVMYEATASSVVHAYIDLAILHQVATTEYLHHVMIFGMLVWATSMFASYAVFGHRRALNAVILVGVLLVLNMTWTSEDQLGLLVVFSLASLFLLIRSHVFDEQAEWLRRRVGDPASISSVYLRGGTTFIAVTVAAACILTLTASSAPLAGAWAGVGNQLISVSRSLSRFLPTGGSSRSIGLDFGPNTAITGEWTTQTTLALTIDRLPTDLTNYYWRAATYDKIEFKTWGQSPVARVDRAAGASLFEGMADDIPATGRPSVTFGITPAGYSGPTIVSPATPVKVDQPVRVSTLGNGGYYVTVDRVDNSGKYFVTALVGGEGNDPGQWNANALHAAAPTVVDAHYPTEITALYTLVPPNTIGPSAKALEDKIVRESPSMAPVDLAQQIVSELKSSTYKYDTDVRDAPCDDLSTVECFARFKRGYCLYYASTMAILLRDLGIPTRTVQGFLPGSRADSLGTEKVLFSNAHAWVEVWFPGYGWVMFDPTGGNLQGQIGPLPSGKPVASSPAGQGSSAPIPSRRDPRDINERDISGVGAGSSSGGGPAGPLIAVTLLLVLVVGVIGFTLWRRGSRGTTTADGAYGMVAWLAARFGFGPRPTQTVYEFTGSLSDVLPESRPELQVVARAKVESVYARQVMAGERLDQLRQAQRRLRLALLRLAFRRRERRRR